MFTNSLHQTDFFFLYVTCELYTLTEENWIWIF